MNVICIEEEAFYALFERVFLRIKAIETKKEHKWISGEEVMKILRIKSKTTLQKLRDGGHIRLSQPEKKIILYETASLYAYLEKHVRNPF